MWKNHKIETQIWVSILDKNFKQAFSIRPFQFQSELKKTHENFEEMIKHVFLWYSTWLLLILLSELLDKQTIISVLFPS